MEDLSLSTSTLDIGGASAQTYQRAAKLFLNKQFPESFEALEPLLYQKSLQGNAKLWTKIWNLYFALVNNAARDSTGSSWPRKLAKQLTEAAEQDKVWDQAQTAFGSLENMPSEVIVNIILVSTAHSKDLQKVSSLVESYISSTEDASAAAKVTRAYVLKLLPKKGDYDYAEELVKNSEVFIDKSTALASIQRAREDYEAKAKEEEEKRIQMEKLEQKRMEESIASLKKQQEEKEREQRAASEVPTDSTKEVQESNIPKNGREGSPVIPIRNQHQNRGGPRSLSSLVTYWRQSFVEFIRQTSLMKLILFIAVIILAGTNPYMRQRLRRMIALLYTKLMQTVRMGTKVSYV